MENTKTMHVLAKAQPLFPILDHSKWKALPDQEINEVENSNLFQ